MYSQLWFDLSLTPAVIAPNLGNDWWIAMMAEFNTTTGKHNEPLDSAKPTGASPGRMGVETPALTAALLKMVSNLPGAVGATVSCRDGAGWTVAAHWGCGADLARLQSVENSGPIVDAVVKPVIPDDVWTDTRWPRLDRPRLRTDRSTDRLRSVSGVAALRVISEIGGFVVLAVALNNSDGVEALQVLLRHEPMVADAVMMRQVSIDNQRRTDDVLELLQSRATIEQAKGIVMGLCGCAADRAWTVLQDTSSQLNVKVRNLSIALIELRAGVPARQPADPRRRIIPTEKDREAAVLLWAFLAEEAPLKPVACGTDSP